MCVAVWKLSREAALAKLIIAASMFKLVFDIILNLIKMIKSFGENLTYKDDPQEAH